MRRPERSGARRLSSHRLAAVVITIAGVLSLSISPVHAQSGANARALFESGLDAADQGRWSDAQASFEASLELLERPNTHFNLGIALQEQAQHESAIRHFERYLEIAPQDPGESARRTEARERVERSRARVVHDEPNPDHSATPRVDPEPDLEAAPVGALEADDSSILESPWFWLVTGIVVAGGVILAVLLTSEDDLGGNTGWKVEALESAVRF